MLEGEGMCQGYGEGNDVDIGREEKILTRL